MMQLLTRDIAWAAATDTGDRSMRKAGRSKWNFKDFNAAVCEFNRLWPERTGANDAAQQGNTTLTPKQEGVL